MKSSKVAEDSYRVKDLCCALLCYCFLLSPLLVNSSCSVSSWVDSNNFNLTDLNALLRSRRSGPVILSITEKEILKNFQLEDNPYLLTGYYQPLICGSVKKTHKYRYPIHHYHPDLVAHDRNYLSKHQDHVLLWTNDPVALFFVHIQGSALVALRDSGKNAASQSLSRDHFNTLHTKCGNFNKVARLKFAGRNKFPYRSVAKAVIDAKLLSREEVTKATLENLFYEMPPKQRNTFLGYDRSYIFHTLEKVKEVAPRGSANIPLKPYISVAADRSRFAFSEPLIIEYDNQFFATLVHDTGAAIKEDRLDLFIGTGPSAGKIAGDLKEKVKVYRLKPSLKRLKQ